MRFADALQNLLQMMGPVAIYAVVVQWRLRCGLRELSRRLGCIAGAARWYGIAALVTLPFVPLVMWISNWTRDFEGSMLKPFVNAEPSTEVFMQTVNYGLISTGLPEELLFRGLIAGALFRRLSFRNANIIQALLFMLPHLLLLFLAPTLWPIAIVLPLGLGLLLGWLRERSGSIGPCVILHAVPNIVGALSVLAWRA